MNICWKKLFFVKKIVFFWKNPKRWFCETWNFFLEGVFVQILNSIEFALRLVDLELKRAQARTQKLSPNVGLTMNKTEVLLGPILNLLKACWGLKHWNSNILIGLCRKLRLSLSSKASWFLMRLKLRKNLIRSSSSGLKHLITILLCCSTVELDKKIYITIVESLF